MSPLLNKFFQEMWFQGKTYRAKRFDRLRFVLTAGKFAAVFTLAASLSGCALISTGRSSQDIAGKSRPEIRDVPYYAREGGELNPRKRVIVLPFLDAEAVRSEKIAEYAREAFIKTLHKTNEFVIVSHTDFPKDVKTYMRNGEYDLEAMATVAAGMGLSAIIEGRVLNVQAVRVGEAVGVVRQVRARIRGSAQIRMVNTKNGSIIMDEVRQSEVEDAIVRFAERSHSDRMLQEDPRLIQSVITKAFEGTIEQILKTVEKLSWEGRVALVKGDRVYVNAGRLSGLQIGDVLKVMEEGEDVYDPDNGSFIGRVPGRLKGTVEIVSYFGKDGSIAIVHSGSGFRENDRIELY